MEDESERKILFENLEERLEKSNVSKALYSVGEDQYSKVCLVPGNSLYQVYVSKNQINDFVLRRDFLDASYEFIFRILQFDKYNKELLEYQLEILTQMLDKKDKKVLKYKK